MHTRHNLNKIKEIVSSDEMKRFEKEQFLKNNSYKFMNKMAGGRQQITQRSLALNRSRRLKLSPRRHKLST